MVEAAAEAAVEVVVDRLEPVEVAAASAVVPEEEGDREATEEQEPEGVQGVRVALRPRHHHLLVQTSRQDQASVHDGILQDL